MAGRVYRGALTKATRNNALFMELPLSQSMSNEERLLRMLVDQLGHKYYNAIAEGLAPAYAAELCGVTEETHGEWMERGRKDARNVEKWGGDYSPEALYYLRTRAVLADRKATDIVWYRDMVAEDPQLWACYLALQERFDNKEYGKKLSGQMDVNKSIKIEFVERDGKEWLGGNKKVELLSDDSTIESAFVEGGVGEEIRKEVEE